MDISVLIPACGEAENLRFLLPELIKELRCVTDKYEIAVVDKHLEGDLSEQICTEFGVRYILQKSDGYGAAFREGISRVCGAAVAVVDADGSQDISALNAMYKTYLSGADVVIGSRYARGGVTHDKRLSVIMSRLLNFAFRLFCGFKQHDISTDFRIYKASLLGEINTVCRDFDVVEEALFLLTEKNPRIIIREVPICYGKRKEGVSKRKTLRFIVKYLKLLTRLFFRRLRSVKRR